MEHTEQEIEMLARAWYETGGHGRDWNNLSAHEQDAYRDDTVRLLRHPSHSRFVALFRLMREAREQGATEMRERAANEARCPAFRASYDASAIACRISVLPLTVSS